MEVYFLIIASLYYILVILFIDGWKSLPVIEADETQVPAFISVVIPVRNEEKNIHKLIADLSSQKFSRNHFEVIIIDDHSLDNTRSVIQKASKEFKIPIKLLRLKPVADFNGSTKKLAITEGVKNATGDLIVTTDGDCRVGSEWLLTINAYFQKIDSNFLAGPVTFNSVNTTFEKLQVIEFSTLIGSGAASIYWGFPNMCNGANLAFKKNLFEKVGGYQGFEKVISGDDEFLMQKFYKLNTRKIHFIKNKKALVWTAAKPDIREFSAQRKRWAGKWKHHKNISIKLLAIFIFIYHFSIILFLLLAPFIKINSIIIIYFVSGKILLEWILLKNIFVFLEKKLNPLHFIFLQLIYSFYAVIFGLLSNRGHYQWKGRSYKI